MTPAEDGAEPDVQRIVANRARQEELYGSPLGERVRRLTAALGISQARLARTLGMSPAMLSQLAGARRVKIGDPAVLARLQLLDQRCRAMPGPLTKRTVDVLLADVACAHWKWTPGGARHDRVADRPRAVAAPARGTAAEALRRIAAPHRLAAAAAALGPGVPELAEVLRQAASRPG